MRPLLLFLAASLSLLLATTASAQSLSDLLGSGVELADPAQRANVVARTRAAEQAKLDAALRLAAARGLARRIVRPDGTVMELAAFEGDRPVYFITHNVNTAISTGANLLQAAPFSLTGAGLTVGVWDGGSVRATHQEFGSRVAIKDGAGIIDHATHVGGTIGASGVSAEAKGMATAVTLDTYEWTSDKSEMTGRAASYPGEVGRIYLSNHSYGFVAGWRYTGNASPVWDWWGNGTTNTAIEQDFGKYDANARDTDSLAASAPYYLMFRSAGNDRYDNPGVGQSVALSAGGTTTVSYDPAIHPPGDATYRNGYDSLSFDATAKNILTIGSVSDAVQNGVRDASAAFLSGFSSCGPTDDGRIKPDLVANGDGVYSSFSGSNSSYGNISGTSMSSPNATGSAALLINHFGKLFPGQAMRASTLKALLIHTADDRGNAGPDYQYGWGLINVKAAADTLTAYHAAPGNTRAVESRLTSGSLTRTHSFVWDGVSPIRATLAWTDPAGAAITASDSRTPRLVNNLDLKIVAPGGATFSPYVMPFVGNWTAAMFSAPATTGKNNTDNVEQVFIAAPPAVGVYQAVVTVDGTLTNGVQNYSLILSSSTNAAAAAPIASTVSPATGSSGTVILNVAGSNFLLGATVKLTRSGQPEILASGIETLGDTVKFRADITGRASGFWNVVVTNPDGQTATLGNAFSIIGALWQDDLESGATGWTHGNSQGTIDNWALVTTKSRSPTRSFHAAGPASTNINDLNSPAIAVASSASNLTLSFWHNFNFQSGRDGGVLELSLNGGTWLDVTDSNSGASFATGGYNSSFATSGNPNTRNPLNPRTCWSGANTGFTQVVVNLSSTKYAGQTLRARWRLATNSSTASTGWYLDDVALNGGGAAVNLAPTITAEPIATPELVAGTSTALSVAASDDAGEAALTYTWSYTGGSFLTPVSFSENGTNAAKATTATFSAAGSYTFTVTIRDAEGLATAGTVAVFVEQTATSFAITPGSATVSKGGSQVFAARVLDQFQAPLATQPSSTWSVSAGGSITADGTFTAATVGGPFTITATSGGMSATASVMVTGESVASWQARYFTSEEIAAGDAGDLVDADGDGVTNLLEYALGTDPRTSTPAAVPELDANGRLTLTLTRPKALAGISYLGEATGALDGTWPTSVAIEVLSDGDPQTIRLTDPIGAADSPRRFLRLRVTKP